MKISLKDFYKLKYVIILAVLHLFFVPTITNAQNALILNGAYVVENGGTAATNIHIVINQPNPLGIVKLSGGGHIHSENQYNFVTWNTASNTGNFVFPFGVGGNSVDAIPFMFNKTAGNNMVSISTWATDPQNNPKPELTNVAAVSYMDGVTDSVLYAIDRFWDIQASDITADLTFSYRGSENTTISPTSLIQVQHWNGSSWDSPVHSDSNGVASGIGIAGAFTGQNTFSPWVLIIPNCTDTVILNPEICEGDDFVVGSSTYTVSGTYEDTLVNVLGRDSIITTHLTVNPVSINNMSATICEGDSILLGGAYQTTSGIYNDIIFNGNIYGCDSIIITNLTVNPVSINNMSATICEGDSILLGGAYQTTSGIYNDIIFNGNIYGCDSIIITNLTVNPVSINNMSATICEGDSILLGGAYQTTSGIYNDIIFNGNIYGCDSIIITNLTVNPVSINNMSATICEGDSILLGGAYQTTSGIYNDIIFNGNIYGCDSIIITNLTVNPVSINNMSATICEGDSILLGGAYQTTSGIYNDIIFNGNIYGCDSIIITNLTVNSSSTTTQTYVKCEGFSVTVGTNTYTTTGVYTDIINNCDTLITDLTILPNPQVILIKTDDNCSENSGSIIADVISDNTPITFIWSTGSADSIINNLSAGMYSVTVTDSNECFYTDFVTLDNIDIDCDYFVYLPNVFSPNGDGHNDVFYVRGKGIKTISLRIYNRWGNQVFESNNLNEGWDGTYKGTIQNTSVFVFMLEVTFINGKTLTKSGDISIIR